jgi:hypothetical protein
VSTQRLLIPPPLSVTKRVHAGMQGCQRPESAKRIGAERRASPATLEPS